MNPNIAAEQMQTAFCNNAFANVSHIIGSDWSCNMTFKNAIDYQRAAYDRADSIFGILPYRFELSEFAD